MWNLRRSGLAGGGDEAWSEVDCWAECGCCGALAGPCTAQLAGWGVEPPWKAGQSRVFSPWMAEVTRIFAQRTSIWYWRNNVVCGHFSRYFIR